MKDKARTTEKRMKVSPKNMRGFDKILPFSDNSACLFCVFFSIISMWANLRFFQYQSIFSVKNIPYKKAKILVNQLKNFFKINLIKNESK